ncbi:MAG: RNA polymerase sigma factor [Pseudomonadota bacterium]
MNRFLADVEKRAFNIARLSIGHADDALDLVQDSMFAMVERYLDRPPTQWPPLFYRILKNRIRDYYRRRGVWRRWFVPQSAVPLPDGQDAVSAVAPTTSEPVARAALDRSLIALEAAIAALPRRQQQAYLLREIEGLSVADTARAMGCSEGSVKTHCSRANQALRAQLGEYLG